jgi:hypothetical protein
MTAELLNVTGIDAEYTRPGIEATLMKFEELTQDVENCEHYKLHWR